MADFPDEPDPSSAIEARLVRVLASRDMREALVNLTDAGFDGRHQLAAAKNLESSCILVSTAGLCNDKAGERGCGCHWNTVACVGETIPAMLATQKLHRSCKPANPEHREATAQLIR